MPTPSTRGVAVSFALHAALLGFAARGATTQLSRRSTASLTALEVPIAIESRVAGVAAPSSGAVSVAAKAPAVAEADAAPSKRARVVRAASAPAPVIAALPPAAPEKVIAPAEAAPAPSEATAARQEPPPRYTGGGSGVSAGALPLAAGAAPLTAASGAGDGDGRATSTGNRSSAPQLAGYLQGVRAKVTRHREYPYLARRANLQGTVCLRVTIAASGRVLDVTPTCGVSHAPLLQAALKSVSSAAPFPPLPAALGQRLTVDVPVVFELDDL